MGFLCSSVSRNTGGSYTEYSVIRADTYMEISAGFSPLKFAAFLVCHIFSCLRLHLICLVISRLACRVHMDITIAWEYMYYLPVFIKWDTGGLGAVQLYTYILLVSSICGPHHNICPPSQHMPEDHQDYY